MEQRQLMDRATLTNEWNNTNTNLIGR